MSLTNVPRKIRSSSGKELPNYARVVADALRRDFGPAHGAAKLVAGLTKANERAVKNWFAAKNGPSGHHLVKLMHTSDAVLEAVLIMAGRRGHVTSKKLANTEQLLIQMLELVGELRG